jgi:hypothetical protein
MENPDNSRPLSMDESSEYSAYSENCNTKTEMAQSEIYPKKELSFPLRRMLICGAIAGSAYLGMMAAVGYFMQIPLDDEDYYYQLVLGMSLICFVFGAWISSGSD